jgi:hypothetical protein
VRRTEIVAAAFLLLVGFGLIGVVIPHGVVDTGASSALPPAFMPYVAAGLSLIGAASLLVAAVRGGTTTGVTFTLDHWRFLGATVAVLGGSCLLMSLFGYLVGAAAVVAGTLLLARVRVVTAIITAVLAPVVLWLLFVKLLGTPLP